MPMKTHKMVDMAQKTMREVTTAAVEAVDAPKEPKYPWGLKVELCYESLQKLGYDADDFTVDMPIIIQAKAKVCSVRKSEYEDYDTGEPKYDHNVELQITHMHVMHQQMGTMRDMMKMMGVGGLKVSAGNPVDDEY